MAKRKIEMTAADAMRQVMAGGAKKTGDVVAAVKSQFGISVKPAYVSQFKSVDKKRRRRRGRKAATAKGPTHKVANVAANSALLAGVEFVKQAGSIEAAKELLAVIEEIRGLR